MTSTIQISIAYNATNYSAEDLCTRSETWRDAYAIYFVVIFLVVLSNGFLLIGIGMSWRFLRQNSIYFYLISCSCSAIVFCSSMFYEIYYTSQQLDNSSIEGGVSQRYNNSIASHRASMLHFAFRKGFLTSMWLVMELSVVALIYAVGDNAQFIGRYSEPKIPTHAELAAVSREGHKKREKQSKAYTFKRKRIKAVIFITLSWLIPILLSVGVAFGWNCAEYCECLPALRHTFHECLAPEGSFEVCSRQWLPMSRSFIIAITALYFCGFSIMFGMLTSTIRKFNRTHAPRDSKVSFSESKRKRIDEMNTTGQRTSKAGFPTSSSQSYHGNSQKSSHPPIVRMTSLQEPKLGFDNPIVISDLADPNNSNPKSYSPTSAMKRRSRPPLHSTIKLLILLTISLFFSITPPIVIVFFDVIFTEIEFRHDAVIVASAITCIHATSLPFILLKYMNGLQTAGHNILLRCPCLYTTVITKRPRAGTAAKTLENNALRVRNLTKKSRGTVVACNIPIVPELKPKEGENEEVIDISTSTEHNLTILEKYETYENLSKPGIFDDYADKTATDIIGIIKKS